MLLYLINLGRISYLIVLTYRIILLIHQLIILCIPLLVCALGPKLLINLRVSKLIRSMLSEAWRLNHIKPKCDHVVFVD